MLIAIIIFQVQIYIHTIIVYIFIRIYSFSDVHNLCIGKSKVLIDGDKDNNSQFLGGSLQAVTSHLTGNLEFRFQITMGITTV